jgi:hypothetical protein
MSASARPANRWVDGLTAVSGSLLALFVALELYGYLTASVLIGELAYGPLVLSAFFLFDANRRESRRSHSTNGELAAPGT